eukprot:142433-Pyramimonas_sp.AAC.4
MTAPTTQDVSAGPLVSHAGLCARPATVTHGVPIGREQALAHKGGSTRARHAPAAYVGPALAPSAPVEAARAPWAACPTNTTASGSRSSC